MGDSSMSALSDLRKLAQEKYPSLPLDLDNGVKVELRSIMFLDDDTRDQFMAAQEALAAQDEEEDIGKLRPSFVNILSLVSDNADATRAALDQEPLAVLIVLFEEYGRTVTDAAKSESDSESS
jgi:hypothetical protein